MIRKEVLAISSSSACQFRLVAAQFPIRRPSGLLPIGQCLGSNRRGRLGLHASEDCPLNC